MKALGVFDIKTRLSEICDEVARTGEPVLVTKRGKPFVRIAPLDSSDETRSPVWEARERVEGQDWYVRNTPGDVDFPTLTRGVEPVYDPFSDDDA